jgi:mannitol-specific phosphotransferase system IIBC component
MIKNFLQKHRAILLTVVITSAVTTTIASGYFVVKNEKVKAKQQVEALQRSIEELQAKNETNQEVEKDTPVSEVTTQQTPTIKKSVEVAPIKTEEVKEKLVSCLAYDGTTRKLNEDDCALFKQKNALIERAVDKYDNCISSAAVYLANAKERFQDRMASGYSASIEADYNNSIGEYNDTINECVSERNTQLKNLK